MIYKYIGADSSEKLLEILKYFVEDGSIKSSDPREFNDPSEFKVLYDFSADDDIIRQRYFLDNPSSTIGNFEDWRRSFNDQSEWYIRYTTRKAALSSYGVVSLAIESDNYLMWSHYAKDHRGFCIGFDEKILESIEGRMCSGKVEYSSSVPVFNYFTQTESDFLKAIFFNKSAIWGYENEVRVVTEGHGIINFDKKLVKEIIIGCKTSSLVEKYVRDLISSPIDIFHMIDLPGEYKLIKERIEQNTYVEKS